jgi:hypothetical protein
VTIDLGPRWTLASSHQGHGGDTTGPQRRFVFTGPRASSVEDRSISFVVAPAEGGAPGGSRPVAVVATAIVALALGLALWLRRQRDRPRRT